MTRKKCTHFALIIYFLLLGSIPSLYAQEFGWARRMAGTGNDVGNGVATDAIGNVYVVGDFLNTIKFDGGSDSLISLGGNEAYLAKYDSDGILLWTRRIGNNGYDNIAGVVVDISGNVYIIGSFSNTILFSNGSNTDTLKSIGSADVYIIKYDGSGNYKWGANIGGTGWDSGYGIATDGADGIYLTGIFRSSMILTSDSKSDTLNAVGADDIFVTKFDTAGNYIWAKNMGGSGADMGKSIAADSLGNVWVSGYFTGTADFNIGGAGGYLTSLGRSDAFIARYDAAGNFVWAKKLGGPSTSLTAADEIRSLAVDALQNVYVAGFFIDSVDFNPGGSGGNLIAVGNSGIRNVFMAKYDASGNFVWAKSVIGNSSAQGIALDIAGNIYITGGCGAGVIDFNPGGSGGSITVPVNQAVFTAKYAPNGNLYWVHTAIGTSAASRSGNGLVVDATNNVYIVGNGYLPADFNPGGSGGELTNVGNLDAYLFKLVQGCEISVTLTHTACDRYVFNGTTYTISGTYRDTFPSSSICDSIVTLNLTIVPSVSNSITITECDSFRYNGTNYTVSGTYTHTFTSATNCDSVVTLNLAINKSSQHSITLSECDSVDINGTVYNTSGTYTQVHQNATGCDSTLTIQLTINPSYSVDITDTACDSYILNGEEYTASGIYTQTLATAEGCDSIITLALTIKSASASVLQADNMLTAGLSDSYQWLDCGNSYTPIQGATGQVFVAEQNGSYAVVVEQNGCMDTSDCYAVTILAVNSLMQYNGIKVYPNPTKDRLNISTEKSLNNATVRLVNILGQLLAEQTGQYGNLFTIDISTQPAGIYWLEVVENGKNAVIKIIKE